MRIAFVYDAIYPYVAGGAERRCYEIGRRLAERGHEVELIGWQWWGGAPVRTEAGVRLRGVGRATSLHDAAGRRTFREALSFAAHVVPHLARIDADLVECSSIPYVPTFVAAALRKVRRIPLSVCWHEYMGEGWRTYAGRRASIAAAVERHSARLGDRRIAVSRFTARRLPAGPPVSVVENGADIAAIAAAVPRARTADIVMAARLVPHKRVHLLLEAIAQLPGATAQVIGDGPERSRLEDRARTLGVADRVTFSGRLESEREVYAAIGSARVMLIASAQEGFGISVVEAQAAGTAPVVVRAPLSAADELVVDGHTGLVTESDPDAIARALRRLLADGALRDRIGHNAQSAVRRFDWNAVAERAEGIYLSMIRESNAPARERAEEVAT